MERVQNDYRYEDRNTWSKILFSSTVVMIIIINKTASVISRHSMQKRSQPLNTNEVTPRYNFTTKALVLIAY